MENKQLWSDLVHRSVEIRGTAKALRYFYGSVLSYKQ